MSRFKYSLFINDKHIADYTSINHFLFNNMELFRVEKEILPKREECLPLIEAFKIPPFSKRKPQVYEDKKRNFKLISKYVELSGKMNVLY